MAIGNVLYTPRKALTSDDIVDTLTSTASDLPLSAAQGNILDKKHSQAQLPIHNGNTVAEISSIYDNYSSDMPSDTYYKGIVKHNVGGYVLGGGTYLLEGLKTSSHYEFQKATIYSDDGGHPRTYCRTKWNNTFGDWDILVTETDIRKGWCSKKIQPPSSAYRWYVIPLIIIDNNPTWRNSYFSGNLIAIRDNGLYVPVECKVICQKQYNSSCCYYYFAHTTIPGWMQIQPITFLHNGKRHFGLLYKQPGAMFTWIHVNGNISDATIPEYVPIYDTQNNAILNPEIYNSLDSSTTYMSNNIKFVE